MVELAKRKTTYIKIKAAFREILGIFVWISITLKLAVYDFDIYLINNYAPTLHWVLEYKFVVLLGVISISWLIIGRKNFPLFFIYVAGYPFVLIFWKIPKLVIRNWSAAFIVTPIVFEIFTEFRFYFISFSLATISAICILAPQSTISTLLPSMVTLFILLVIHLWSCFKQAYKSTVFSKLSRIMSIFKEKLEDISFLRNILDKNKIKDDELQNEGASDNGLNRQLTNFYIIHCLIDFITEKIRYVTKSRIMDIYFLLSWFSAFIITCIIFSFEYLALFKINPKSFSVPFEPSYFSFLGFSFGKMTPASVSKIVPGDLYADAICYIQLASSIIIIMILFFTFLTAARERYKEDIETIIDDMNEIAAILQQGSLQIFNLAVSEVEIALMNHDHKLVNGIRTLRGMQPLPPPVDSSSEQHGSEVS